MSTRSTPCVHAAPFPGFTTTACCGVPTTELLRHHLVSPDLVDVTCPGRPVSPVRELVAITLTSTRLPGTRARRFLHHGDAADDRGHVYDERCALCVRDVPALAGAVTSALIAAFPHADMRNLQATPPPGRVARARRPYARLFNFIGLVLTTTVSATARPGDSLRPHGPPDGHRYHPACAMCRADADALACAVESALNRALPTVIPVRPRTRRVPVTTSQGAS
jgi:hypothetical protein